MSFEKVGTSAVEKAKKYIEMTAKALEVVEIVPPPNSYLRRVAELLLDMARRYWEDAKYYLEKDPLTALAAASYAHAWLDVGVVLGLLKGEDPKLFMVEP